MANPDPRAVPPVPDAPSAPLPNGRSTRTHLLSNGVVALLLGLGLASAVRLLAQWVMIAALGLGDGGVASAESLPRLVRDNALVAGAGPVVGVLLGLAMQVLQPFRFRGDFAHLLWIWTACSSLMLAAVPLACAPFGGDLSVVLVALRLPAWVGGVAVAAGVAAVLGVAHQWAIHAVRLCGREVSRLLCFSVYPWLIGTVVQAAFVLTVVYLDRLDIPRTQALVPLLGGAALTAFAPLSLLFTRRTDELEEPLLVGRVPWVAVLALVLLAAGFGAARAGLGIA